MSDETRARWLLRFKARAWRWQVRFWLWMPFPQPPGWADRWLAAADEAERMAER